MPTSSSSPSSKTPPTEGTLKPASGSGVVDSSAPASAEAEANLQTSPSPDMLDRLHDAISIFTTDLRGVITSCSQGRNQSRDQDQDQGGDQSGFLPKDLVGRNLAAFYIPGKGAEKSAGKHSAGQQPFLASRAIASVLADGRFEDELLCRNKSGQYVDVHLYLTLLRDANADPAGILAFSIESASIDSAEPMQTAAGCSAVPLARR